MAEIPNSGAEVSGSGSSDFISEFIKEDLQSGKYTYVHTRFPPEPNGWLHIGHCKAITVDFSMAQKFGGKCNLRFDDTNPEKENYSYVEAIKRDIKWLGFDWEDREYFASDYYEYLYDIAVKLIKKGKAYVDDLSEEEIREYRGTAVADKNNITHTPPGRNSPYRDRTAEENLDLFARMRAGEFADGTKTLRAKIDMTHPNLVMRDPVMYRIRRATHYRTGDSWCIYPMYDYQHPLSDAKEGITHSLCSLEFEIHRPLYEWFINEAEVFPSRQIEFARLNITHTVLSKRWLFRLVSENLVNGWDDPRMPTLAGLRRRGYTAEAIRDFMSRIGVAKTDSMVDIAFLEYCLREDLNKRSSRIMAVLKPLKLIIENWEAGETEELEAINNPEDESAGKRKIYFSRELWIERDDFQEIPPPKYFRLYPGNSVRLRYGYIVTCTGFDKDPATGEITAVRCTYDPETKGGNAPDNRKVKGTIHWLSAAHAVPIEVRVYDYLFSAERPMEVAPGGSFLDNLNPDSLEVITGAYGEPGLAAAAEGDRFQFERLGYFARDPETSGGIPVFNKTVGLRDTWAKIEKKSGQ
ncbi:glutamine--tRNA ligase/YqeY domain fusion protein [Breznakiella homolactica]|uniref:Glutamine--tRNA ligase n=1 Tax=Breznakiella homolactica TaxID=2798577 RepID=A0A7T7XPY6_9SPIR|nr:glutamine--tRNA ligase/YqeY domain fusion protein [Breznakiella homolactica]QQO10332.1 glutamine--tRNA ligase/YqeY domain fusion protein [Breznakiella homolactica]